MTTSLPCLSLLIVFIRCRVGIFTLHGDIFTGLKKVRGCSGKKRALPGCFDNNASLAVRFLLVSIEFNDAKHLFWTQSRSKGLGSRRWDFIDKHRETQAVKICIVGCLVTRSGCELAKIVSRDYFRRRLTRRFATLYSR